jgi:hypothetical protein
MSPVYERDYLHLPANIATILLDQYAIRHEFPIRDSAQISYSDLVEHVSF